MLWRSYILGFESYMMLERSLSQNSISAYLHDVNLFVQFLDQKNYKFAVNETDHKHISEFLAFIHDLGLQDYSQARILSGLRAFFNYLLMEDLVSADPTELIEGPKLTRKIPDFLTYEEIEKILSAIDLSHPQGQRNRAMIETLYACGLRVSELINLRLSNYFPDIGYIKVIGKNDKERIIPIGEEAIKHIDLYLNSVRRLMSNIDRDHEDYIFLNRRGRKLTRVMIFTIIKELVKIAGISKKVSPHTFRHSFATHLVEGGADLKAVQDMLGHESITTTEIYTHLDKHYLRETLLSFHPRSKA